MKSEGLSYAYEKNYFSPFFKVQVGSVLDRHFEGKHNKLNYKI